MPADSPLGLTVREAARDLGVHVQTVRATVRAAEEAGQPIAAKLTGSHGPEWRLCPAVVFAMHGESHRESADLTQTDSPPGVALWGRIETILRGLTEAQQAALPSPEEVQARADREARIAAALEAGPDLRALAEALGRAEAERDQARAQAAELRAELATTSAERDQAQAQAAELRGELEAERARPWWRRVGRRD